MSTTLDSPIERLFFGPQEVADLLGASRGFVYNLMDSGKLKNLKLGGRRMIPSSEIERLIRMAEGDQGTLDCMGS